jgi:carboxymethylenebutenolidase
MGELVSYPSNGGTSQGYLAQPASGGGPGVIVIQEYWGLVPHIKTIAERLAADGFVSLAPDLYHGVQAAEPDEAGKLIMGLAMDQAAKDIGGAASYLAGLPGVGQNVGTVGFCAGGSLALWSATLSERIVAAVGFYPVMPWERMSPTWSHYAGKAAMIHCDEADGFAAEHPGVRAAVKAIEESGGTVTTYDYPGTKHAFFNDDRPEVFAAEAASLSWARTLELFRSRLG